MKNAFVLAAVIQSLFENIAADGRSGVILKALLCLSLKYADVAKLAIGKPDGQGSAVV